MTTISITENEFTDTELFRTVVERLLECQRTNRAVTMDFSGFALGSKHRVRNTANQSEWLFPIILSNVLLVAAGAVPLRVKMPRNDSAVLVLLRSGILFSLRNRHASLEATDIEGLGTAAEVSKWLDLWNTPWSPMAPTLGMLFETYPRPVDRSDVLANRNNAKHAIRVVIDSHLERRERLLDQATNGLGGSWLTKIVPESKDPDLREKRRRWSSVVASRLLGEPLINVPDHALTKPPNADPIQRVVHSLLLLGRTDGGGAASYPRLQILIADNGYGMIASLRDKVDRIPAAAKAGVTSSSSGEDLLRYAASGPAETIDDPGLSWARVAFGFAATAGAAGDDDPESQFCLVSGDPNRNHAVTWASVPRSGEVAEIKTSNIEGVPFHGSTVVANLAMPHHPSARPSVEDEVTELVSR